MPKETPITDEWVRIEKISAQKYVCGWCGNGVAPDNGWYAKTTGGGRRPLIQVCPFCNKPTLWDTDNRRYPAPRIGDDINHLPEAVEALYDEVRDCVSVNAYTAVVHVCRTLISHVAVEKGAKKGDTYNHHIEYLKDNNHLPNGSEVWVEVIRTKGGEAAHQLKLMTSDEAAGVLKFTEMLLRIAIEYPEVAKLGVGKVKVANGEESAGEGDTDENA